MTLRGAALVMALTAGAGVPAAAAGPGADSAGLKALAPAIRRNLEQAIVRFWYPRSIDRVRGGYVLAFDETGASTGTPDKMIVSQARMVWLFARLARSGYRVAEMRAAAAQGFRFLADRMWDAEHGGFYWKVDATGTRVTDDGKYIYGESFGLYALAEYYRATGDEQALALATRLFDLIVRHGRDPEFGGYYEFFTREWGPPPAGARSHVGGPAGAKLMNTHLHLLEAFAEYYRASGSVEARERLHELITIQSNTVVRQDLTACTDQYRRDWTPILDADGARVSYGHDLENIWLLADAVGTVGQSNAPLLDLYRRLFAYSRQHGFDEAQGGVYASGAFRQPADQRNKIWWVQAEALVSALTMYTLTGDADYADVFLRTWRWVDTRQTDWTHGEWYQEVRPDASHTTVKADQWKEGYHNGRALLLCLELLERL
jgi:mannobiose 2-epimerase